MERVMEMIHKNTIILPIRLCIVLYALTFCLSCQSYVTFTIENGSGPPHSEDATITVTLDNQYVEIRGVQMNICDVDDYLTCTGCETTDRTPGFFCKTNESDNGCCRMLLVSLSGDTIDVGTGAIFAITYDVSEEAPEGECRDLNPENVNIVDEYKQPSDVKSVAIPGEFCFEGNEDENEPKVEY